MTRNPLPESLDGDFWTPELASAHAQRINDAQLPYVVQLDRWRTAVANRAARRPRVLMVGDSAHANGDSWLNLLSGRRVHWAKDASVTAGDLSTPFANGLYDDQRVIFQNAGTAVDMRLLIAAPAGPQTGEVRYDEGPWREPWVNGTPWSAKYPPNGLIDQFAIPNMGGANTLTIRTQGGAGNVWWYGLIATTSNRPIESMSLALDGKTAKWWRDEFTKDTTVLDNWGAATIRALAHGFNPDLVIVALGANDLDDPSMVNNVGAHLGTIVDALRADCPNADVALQTYWQPVWEPVRDQVLATAKAKNTALLDFWPKIPAYAAGSPLFADQFHLSAAGQQMVADIAVRQLGITLP